MAKSTPAIRRMSPIDTPTRVGYEIPASGRVSVEVGVAVNLLVGVRVAEVEAVGVKVLVGVGVPERFIVGVEVGKGVGVKVGAWASSSWGAIGEILSCLDRKILVAVKTAIPARTIVAAAMPIIGSLRLRFSFIRFSLF